MADALRERLDALSSLPAKWTPDILHFLLELSDQPTQNSRLEDLDLLAKPDLPPEHKLTWAAIAKEDGWYNDGALWRNVDFAGSSDEEDFVDARSDASSRSGDSSISTVDDYQQTAQALILKPGTGADEDRTPLQQIEDGQAWRHVLPQKDWDGRTHKIAISDYQFLREVLFMLRGLQTTLFDSKGSPVLKYQLTGVSWDSFKALVTSFAECGRSLRPLRSFAAQSQQIPLLQVFRDAVERSLGDFDRRLSEIQTRFAVLTKDVVVSLMGVHREVKSLLAPLSTLSNIVRRLEEEQYAHPFRYLELLFDATGVAQLEGNEIVYRHLGTIFFDCFQVYLRPIRLWMEDGIVIPGDRTFFVSQSATKTPLTQLWRGQFKLRQTQAGILHAPRFLQPSVKRIFTTGKSINVLKHLGRYELVKEQWTGAEPVLDFSSVCTGDLEFAPFPELFNHAFDLWVHSKHHTTSATLRKVLFESCGLSQALDSLQGIYLCSDGSVADAFATPLFRHLDALSPSWKDHFTLTELAQEAFSPCADSYHLSAKIDQRFAAHSGMASRSSVRASLPGVRLAYRLPWPVQLIIPESSITGYHGVFTFLLQLRRGAYVLRKHWVAAPRPNPSSSSSVVSTDNPHRLYFLIRTKLIWFCETVAAYLASMVLAPNISTMRAGLRDAVDVDDMIGVHAAFVAKLVDEACLGPKLNPLRDCILDVLDLAVKLEDAHRREVAKEAQDLQEISRLSVMSSPRRIPLPASSKAGPGKGRRRATRTEGRREDDNDDDYDRGDSGSEVEDLLNRSFSERDKGYPEVLSGIHADYEKHLRFITGGLRGVARATRDPAAGKWDVLAEMLEMGFDSSK